MRMKRIGFGLVVVFISGQCLVAGAQAESLFKDILKATGSVYKFTGQAMDNVSQGREDSLIGKGLKVGGKINKAVGSAMEEAGEEWTEDKISENK
jgi:adenosylcobinamide amidohydrolase